MATKLHKPIYLLQIFSLGCQTRHILIIPIIHHYDAVKIIVIILPEASRTVRQKIPPCRCCRAHSTVGQISRVAAIRSCRVNLKPLLYSGPFNHCTHHPLSRRRSADVPQADKQYLFFRILFHSITKFILYFGLHSGSHCAIHFSQRYQFNSTNPTPPKSLEYFLPHASL